MLAPRVGGHRPPVAITTTVEADGAGARADRRVGGAAASAEQRVSRTDPALRPRRSCWAHRESCGRHPRSSRHRGAGRWQVIEVETRPPCSRRPRRAQVRPRPRPEQPAQWCLLPARKTQGWAHGPVGGRRRGGGCPRVSPTHPLTCPVLVAAPRSPSPDFPDGRSARPAPFWRSKKRCASAPAPCRS